MSSTITRTGPLGIKRGEYISFCGTGIYPSEHRVTDASPDRTALTTRPVGRWENQRRLFENYIQWPIRDFDRWLTAKVRGLIR